MRNRAFITLLLLLCSLGMAAGNNYRVISSSRLNVRQSPSTRGAVIGTFAAGEEIEVISIANGWATVKWGHSTGYVSSRYIEALPVKNGAADDNVEKSPHYEAAPQPVTQEPVTPPVPVVVECDAMPTLMTCGHFLPDGMNVYFGLQAGIGYTTFTWDMGSINPGLGYSVELLAQLYMDERVSFVPRNWYSEFALGYQHRGASDFGMNYFSIRLLPIGYRIHVSPVNIVAKAGVSLGIPLNDLTGYNSGSFGADFQCGINGGVQVEWRQFAVGCMIDYDFTQVSSSCNQSLYNFSVLGTISYKFAKIGHRK